MQVALSLFAKCLSLCTEISSAHNRSLIMDSQIRSRNESSNMHDGERQSNANHSPKDLVLLKGTKDHNWLQDLMKVSSLALQASKNPQYQEDGDFTLKILREAISLTKPWLEKVKPALDNHDWQGSEKDSKHKGLHVDRKVGLLALGTTLAAMGWRASRKRSKEKRGQKMEMLQQMYKLLEGHLEQAEKDVKRLERKLEGRHQGRRRHRRHRRDREEDSDSDEDDSEGDPAQEERDDERLGRRSEGRHPGQRHRRHRRDRGEEHDTHGDRDYFDGAVQQPQNMEYDPTAYGQPGVRNMLRQMKQQESQERNLPFYQGAQATMVDHQRRDAASRAGSVHARADPKSYRSGRKSRHSSRAQPTTDYEQGDTQNRDPDLQQAQVQYPGNNGHLDEQVHQAPFLSEQMGRQTFQQPSNPGSVAGMSNNRSQNDAFQGNEAVQGQPGPPYPQPIITINGQDPRTNSIMDWISKTPPPGSRSGEEYFQAPRTPSLASSQRSRQSRAPTLLSSNVSESTIKPAPREHSVRSQRSGRSSRMATQPMPQGGLSSAAPPNAQFGYPQNQQQLHVPGAYSQNPLGDVGSASVASSHVRDSTVFGLLTRKDSTVNWRCNTRIERVRLDQLEAIHPGGTLQGAYVRWRVRKYLHGHHPRWLL